MSKFRGRSITFQLMDVSSGCFTGREVKLVLPLDSSHTSNTVLIRDGSGKPYVARRRSSVPTMTEAGRAIPTKFLGFRILNL